MWGCYSLWMGRACWLLLHRPPIAAAVAECQYFDSKVLAHELRDLADAVASPKDLDTDEMVPLFAYASWKTAVGYC